MQIIKVPRYRFYESTAVGYFELEGYIRRVNEVVIKNNLKNSAKYTGYLSKSAAKKIYTVLTAWLTCVKIYNNYKFDNHSIRRHVPIFVTLTLSEKQKHDDRFIKAEMLEPFLSKLIRDGLTKHYFWRAESQANGNIHFHLILDNWVDMRVIQGIWNSIQSKHGYTDNYHKTKGHRNPPSTHVEGLWEIENAIEYCMKYVSKSDKRRLIQGRLYSFSNGLVSLKPFVFDEYPGSERVVSDYLSKNCRVMFDTEYFIGYEFKNEYYYSDLPLWFKEYYFSYYLSMMGNLYEDLSAGELNDIFCECIK